VPGHDRPAVAVIPRFRGRRGPDREVFRAFGSSLRGIIPAVTAASRRATMLTVARPGSTVGGRGKSAPVIRMNYAGALQCFAGHRRARHRADPFAI